jgi:GNAT superfamily N-acetyltransferase
VFRLATAPDLREDDGLAARLAVDLDDPGRGVLPAGEVSVEVRGVDALARALGERGWTPGEVWSPLRMSLAEPQPAPGIRIEQIDADADDEVLADWAAVHRSAFRGTVLEGEERAAFTSRLRTMLEGPFAGPSRARVIAGYVDDVPDPVAIAAVWSAGPGRPGLLEPMGVHQEHRRRGYGRAIVHASASALADLGASSILVCTETERSAATATYESAGFTPEQTVPDLTRAG